MAYRINPMGNFWNDGVVCVPKELVEKHLKFADGIKLKTLLLLLSDGGRADSDALAARLGISESDARESLEFWVDEGYVKNESDETSAALSLKTESEEITKKVYESLPMPSLTPQDIVRMCNENSELADLLRGSEKILASTLSNAMKSNIINMVTYYGLPVSVVLTLLEYYKSERDAGKNITTRVLQNMAKEWANEEITTLALASEKLQELQGCEDLWNDVIALCQFDYRKMTASQKKMLLRWEKEFDREMIFFACNTMKKYNEEDKQSLKIVDNILKEWKRKGFKTPEDVKSAPKESGKTKSGKMKSTPSFDIDEIQKRAVLNDDFDV